MTFEEFFERCWFWWYHPDETDEYGVEVGIKIDPRNVYIECYEVTEEFFSDIIASKKIAARWLYDNLKKEKVI